MHKEIKKAYQLHPLYEEFYRRLVSDEYGAAVSAMEKLLGESPGNGQYLNDLAVCLHLYGHKDEALKMFQKSLGTMGESSAPFFNLAMLEGRLAGQAGESKLFSREYKTNGADADLSSSLVSIIILDYKNPLFTANCLRSIKEANISMPFEIVLVDNSEGDPPTDYAAITGLTNIIYHKTERNLGFAGGCNLGAKLARGDLLYFVNNDTLFTPNCLEELARVVLSDKRVGAAGSKLLYEDGLIQHAGVVFRSFSGSPQHRYRFHPGDAPLANIPLIMQALTAASLMIRKSLFVEAGAFSEEYSTGFEDLDLCLRLNTNGYMNVYVPGSVLYHLESKSKGRFKHEKRNFNILMKKWSGAIKWDEDDFIPPAENFVLYCTARPDKEGLISSFFKLCHCLCQMYPEVMSHIPLSSIEKGKHQRKRKFCLYMFNNLLQLNKPDEARIICGYFISKYWFRFDYIYKMKKLLAEYHR